ncbi:hypothetical protein GCK32_014836 [Trichostrongylus colubriformis]|uniref:Uncharacterized protein n=1 Tax=Trichostrongylus colubriformis TaxID=6319 RepID=A0AAN8FRW9_TRICO
MWKGTPSSVESPQGTHGKLASVRYSHIFDGIIQFRIFHAAVKALVLS